MFVRRGFCGISHKLAVETLEDRLLLANYYWRGSQGPSDIFTEAANWLDDQGQVATIHPGFADTAIFSQFGTNEPHFVRLDSANASVDKIDVRGPVVFDLHGKSLSAIRVDLADNATFVDYVGGGKIDINDDLDINSGSAYPGQTQAVFRGVTVNVMQEVRVGDGVLAVDVTEGAKITAKEIRISEANFNVYAYSTVETNLLEAGNAKGPGLSVTSKANIYVDSNATFKTADAFLSVGKLTVLGTFESKDLLVGWPGGLFPAGRLPSEGQVVTMFGPSLVTADNLTIVGTGKFNVAGFGSLLKVSQDIKIEADEVARGAGVFQGGVLRVGPLGLISAGQVIKSEYAYFFGGHIGKANVGEFLGQGEFYIGLSPGSFEIEGDYEQQKPGLLDIELAGRTQGDEYDVLHVLENPGGGGGGTATLGGTLHLSQIDGFLPAKDDTFEILTAQNVSGQFDYLDPRNAPLDHLFDGTHAYCWNANYDDPTKVVLEINEEDLPPGGYSLGSGGAEVYEAEYAKRYGGSIEREEEFFTGCGYAQYSYSLEWAVDAPEAGTYDVILRHSLESGSDYASIIVAQGLESEQSFYNLPVNETGDWSNWSVQPDGTPDATASPTQIQVTLEQGHHFIQLSSYSPYIDGIIVRASGNSAPTSENDTESIYVDDAVSGFPIASLTGGMSDDDEADTIGVAVLGSTDAFGPMQFRLDGNSAWQPIGVVSQSDALLLPEGAEIRIVPNTTLDFDIQEALTVVAWDGTSGEAGQRKDASIRGGNTAFSEATVRVVSGCAEKLRRLSNCACQFQLCA